MVERTDTGYEIVCDGFKCQEFICVDSPDHNWNDVIKELRDNSWLYFKRDDEWHHVCPLHYE